MEAQDQNGKALGSFVWFYMGPHVFSYTFSMHQDDPEHKHKIRHSSTCPIKGVLQGIAVATVCEWSRSCCCCGWKCLFVFADRLPWRVRIVSSWMTCEMQLLVGWGSAILQLLCDLFFNFAPATESKIKASGMFEEKFASFTFCVYFS